MVRQTRLFRRLAKLATAVRTHEFASQQHHQKPYASGAEPMTSKDIVQGLSAFVLLCVWLAWVALVFAFMVAGDAFRLFANWFWLVIGGRLFRGGISNDFIVTQLIMSWILIMMFLMIAPLFLWFHINRRKRNTKDTTSTKTEQRKHDTQAVP